MDIASGIAVYVIVWFLSLFPVLSAGAERSANPMPGTPESAPDNPHLLFKFVVTTGIATVIWLGIFALVKSDLISFHDMAARMVGPNS
jgi:predicted secreted protein